MSRRQPMAPVDGLKKPTLPAPSPRPRTLAPVPEPASEAHEDRPEPESERTALPKATRPETATSSASKPPARTRKVREQKAAIPARSASADTMKAVSVSVPLTLAEAWRDRAKKDRTSQVAVLLDAIVAHQGALADLVAARAEKPTVSDGLFERTPRVTAERFIGVSLRIRSSNLDVIDQLVNKHAAESRSQLVAAVLFAYLG